VRGWRRTSLAGGVFRKDVFSRTFRKDAAGNDRRGPRKPVHGNQASRSRADRPVTLTPVAVCDGDRRRRRTPHRAGAQSCTSRRRGGRWHELSLPKSRNGAAASRRDAGAEERKTHFFESCSIERRMGLPQGASDPGGNGPRLAAPRPASTRAAGPVRGTNARVPLARSPTPHSLATGFADGRSRSQRPGRRRTTAGAADVMCRRRFPPTPVPR